MGIIFECLLYSYTSVRTTEYNRGIDRDLWGWSWAMELFSAVLFTVGCLQRKKESRMFSWGISLKEEQRNLKDGVRQ
jgi:hypothetical protein